MKEIAGGQKKAENSTKNKEKNITKYPEKEKSKQNLRSNYTVEGPKRANRLLSLRAKIYSAGSRLATQKVNVRLSLDFWNSLHTFLLSYFSIPLEITTIKGHFKAGPS